MVDKSEFDDQVVDGIGDFEEIQPLPDAQDLCFGEDEYGDVATSYGENFNQSEMVDITSDQIQNDYGEYLRDDAKILNADNVEIKSGSEFEDSSLYGFYDWYGTGKLTVNQDAGGTVETLVHEGLHMATDDGDDINQDGTLTHHLGIEEVTLNPTLGEVHEIKNLSLNEGITEMFTRQTAENMGVQNISIAYPNEVEVAYALSDLVGGDVVKQAYFNNDVDGLCSSVDSKLGSGAFDTISTLMDYGASEAAITIINQGMPVE